MPSDYYHARARLVSALSDVTAHLERHRVGIEHKAIDDVVSSRLGRVVDGGLSNDQSEDDLRNAIIAIILLLSLDAYQEGMRRGGSIDPEGEMTDADRQTISDFQAAQAVFAAGLAASIVEARNAEDKEGARSGLDSRILFWAATFEALRLSGMSSVAGDMMVTWRYGDTDHCTTCLNLNGQRHKLSWFVSRNYIPREPGSNTLDCRGYNCQCGLYDDAGKRVM